MINLLPWREEVTRSKRRQLVTRIALLPIVVLLGAGGMFLLEYRNQVQLQQQLNVINTQVNVLKQAHADAVDLQQKQQLWRDKLSLLHHYQALREQPLPLDILPHKPAMQGVHLLLYSCQLSACEINGVVRKIHQLRPFMDELSHVPSVEELQIKQLLPDRGNNETLFTLSFQLVSDAL
ncbi:PilN domain-containing protein [Vibrio rarus]|uniref:PilN domain-containing protein n=1 Tax=Vibrio rarus TaxID=413403 RepID=UPI0021C37116|nr:hypothetical protein [Vibrio rarus]